MKARFIRDAEVTHPQHKSNADIVRWREKLDRGEITPEQWRAGMYVTVKAETVIDHPHSHMLVKMGMAEPYCPACVEACKGYDIDAAAEGQDRLLLGRITGDPRFDREDEPEKDEPDDEPEVITINTESGADTETELDQAK